MQKNDLKGPHIVREKTYLRGASKKVCTETDLRGPHIVSKEANLREPHIVNRETDLRRLPYIL